MSAAGVKKGPAGKKRKAANDDTLENEKGTVKERRGLFAADLRAMMYGYGDAQQPLPDSVDFVEDVLIDYVVTMMRTAAEESSKRGKLAVDDLIYLVRKDPKKHNRVKQLLVANEEIKEAKKAIETNEEVEREANAGAAAVDDE